MYELQSMNPRNFITFLTFSRKQLREELVLWPYRAHHLYGPRTGDNNPQARGLSIAQTPRAGSWRCGCRIYAVTLKSIPIAVAFASITTAQWGLGICLTVLTARKGGMRSAVQRNHSHSEYRCALPQIVSDSPTRATRTP